MLSEPGSLFLSPAGGTKQLIKGLFLQLDYLKKSYAFQLFPKEL